MSGVKKIDKTKYLAERTQKNCVSATPDIFSCRLVLEGPQPCHQILHLDGLQPPERIVRSYDKYKSFILNLSVCSDTQKSYITQIVFLA